MPHPQVGLDHHRVARCHQRRQSRWTQHSRHRLLHHRCHLRCIRRALAMYDCHHRVGVWCRRQGDGDVDRRGATGQARGNERQPDEEDQQQVQGTHANSLLHDDLLQAHFRVRWTIQGFRLGPHPTPIVMPPVCALHRQPWLFLPGIVQFVTSPCPGYTSRPNRATDSRGLSLHKRVSGKAQTTGHFSDTLGRAQRASQTPEGLPPSAGGKASPAEPLIRGEAVRGITPWRSGWRGAWA